MPSTRQPETKTLTRGQPNRADAPALLRALSDHEAATRKNARLRLMKLGSEAVDRLCDLLAHGDFLGRWEAAKALEEISDPSAAASLVDALRDTDQDVRWVAAEGLVAIGRPAVAPVLKALIEHAGTHDLCREAHHVIHGLQDSEMRLLLAPLFEVLDQPASGADVTVRAQQALRKLPGA